MPMLYPFQSRIILRRLAEIEADAAVIVALHPAGSTTHLAANSARTSAQMAREELLRVVLVDVEVVPILQAAE